MSSNGEWDDRLMDSFKNFDLNSPEFKQQFGKFVFNYSLPYGQCSIHFGEVLDVPFLWNWSYLQQSFWLFF